MASKAQVLNFTSDDISDVLEEAIIQPMLTLSGGVTAWPEREDEQYQLVFFQSAASFIASRLARGVKLNKAQNEWLSIATTLTSAHKSSRKYVRLIDADLMLRESQQLTDLLTENRIKFDPDAFKNVTTNLPVHEYITARLRVLSFEELSSQDTLLRASSLPVTEEHDALNLESALKEIKAREAQQDSRIKELQEQLEHQCKQHESDKVQLAGELEEKNKAASNKEEENEQLLLQLQKVQEEREASYVQIKNSQKQLIDANEEKERLKEELESTFLQAKQAGEKLSTMSSERDKLEAELVRVGEEKSGLGDKLGQFEKQQEELLSQIETLQQELKDKVNVETEVKEENELLLLQLQQVQEELESAYVQAKSADEKLNAVNSELQLLKADFAMLIEERDSLKEEAKDLQEKHQRQVNKVVALQTELKQKTNAENEAKDENELLLLQLQQVQEELERYFLRCKELEGADKSKISLTRIAKLESEIKRKNEKLHSFSQTVKALRADKQKLTDRVEMLVRQPRTTNLPAVIKQPKTKKYRIPTSFLRKVKLPFNGKHEPLEKRTMEQQKHLLISSGLFDEAFYLQQNPDVATSTLEPVEHYIKFGGFEGRNPSKGFNSAFYLSEYPDVREQHINPLVHYLTFGIYEQRSPTAG